MKQYRITSKDIIQDSDEDCALSPSDPIHEIKAAAYLGGLGGNVRVAEMRDRKSTRLNSSHVSESRMPSSA